MAHRDFLLFIDDAPINKDLKDYFAKFNLDIEQQTTLYPISTTDGLPVAILIHWGLLKNNLLEIKQLYSMYPVPLLVVSDTEDEEACISVLENGADDFLIKPLYPRELHARISAINRRVQRSQQQTMQEKEVLLFSTWKLIPASRQVLNEQDQELPLSAGEYDLLYTFIQKPQCVLDREILLQITKNSDLNPFDRRIDVQISRLRQKIEIDPKKPLLIKTIRNGGYMFTAKVTKLEDEEMQ